MNSASSSAAGQRRSNRQQRKVPTAGGGEDNRPTTASSSGAMPPRRSSSSNSLSSVKSQSSTTSRISGSFASATASSLSHGGPALVAPPPSSLLISTPRTMLLPPLPRSKNGIGSSGNDNDNYHDHAGKENATNSGSTPTKNSSGGADDITPPIMLSPTPQWRADRLGYVTGRVRVEKSTSTTATTPTRATRSATKKKRPIGEEDDVITATLDDLADLDDDDDKDEDVDNGDDAAALLLQSSSQSTPPDRKFEIQSARNAQRRRTAVAEAERQRLEKVRKRGESMMSRGLREHSPSTTSSSLVGGGRMLMSSNKRTKRDASSPAVAVAAAGHMSNRYADDNYDEDAKKMLAASPGPSEEDVCRIVLESLASNESTKVEALIAQVAIAERDAAHHLEMYEVAKAKYDTLKCRIETAGGTENELRIKFAEQRDVMDGYEKEIRRLELEKSTLTSRSELEHESYERKRRNMKDEMSGMKETHANERLKADNAAAKDRMISRIAELEEAEVNLKSLLDVEKIDNDANCAIIFELRTCVATHVETITRHEKNVSRLKEEVHSITLALNDAKRQMEKMLSPRTGDALEADVDELREKMSAMKGKYVNLQDTLLATEAERDELKSRLSVTSIAVEEATAKDAKLKVKLQQLSEEVQTAHAKQKEIDKMAEENEQLIAKLKETDSIMKQRLEDASRNADEEVSELMSKFDTVTAERDMLDDKLKTAKGELTSLRETIQSLQSDKQVSDNKVLELSTQLRTITEQFESTKSTITILESKLRTKDEYCEQFESIERQLREEKRVLNEIRANLHNRVIQLSGNIRVFVRVRPLVESERLLTSSQVQPTRYQFASRSGASNSSRPTSRGSTAMASRPASRDGGEETNYESCPFHFPAITDRNTTRPSSSTSGDGGGSFHDLTKQVIELTEPYKDRGGLKERRKKWKYGFDRVFNQNNRQRDVWEGAEPLVQSCIDGFHVCMFAYGQVSYFDRLCIHISIIYPVLTTTLLS